MKARDIIQEVQKAVTYRKGVTMRYFREEILGIADGKLAQDIFQEAEDLGLLKKITGDEIHPTRERLELYRNPDGGFVKEFEEFNQFLLPINISIEKGEIELFKPQAVLPKENKLISQFAEEISSSLKRPKKIFYRPETMEIVEIGEIKTNEGNKYLGMIQIKPNRFITLAEKYFIPGNYSLNKNREVEFVSKSISGDLANTLLQSPQLQDELPQIERIFTIPIPILHEGKITFPKEGHDERFNSFLLPNAPKINNPEMPLEEAKEKILNIYEEFCLKTKQDKTNAIANLLTPFTRGLMKNFNERTPIFVFMANRERAGKDYCANIPQVLYFGYYVEESPISAGDKSGVSNDEIRKKLTTNLINGRTYFHSSNNKGFLNCAVLEGFATSKVWSDRILGGNKNVELPNEMNLSLSGNMGISYTPDFANRSRFIRLFLDIEDANERQFENPDLHGWIAENRELLLSALYSLVKNWESKGMPDGSLPFTSFPEWARVVGGIMESADLGNPCVPDKETLALGGDSETGDMKALFEMCYNKFQNKWVRKNEIVNLIQQGDDELFGYLDFNSKSGSIQFGLKLTKFVGRIFSNIRLIVKDENAKGNRKEFRFVNVVKDVNVEAVKEGKYNNKIESNKTLTTLTSLTQNSSTPLNSESGVLEDKGGEQKFSDDQQSVIKAVVDLESKIGSMLPLDEIKTACPNVSPGNVELILNQLKTEGWLFEPKEGLFQRI